ncbi:alpha/beta fold hydrolase [Phenylobacterium aquaticum]|uniref:alpha/beta fold hydrolase n=1 Tax=Phenylobacterium aquaticum TaxID=1763816 RepID=UPI0026EC797F|nr:alpha/beta hydrolase [Phenylobacterium aquaticum]
MSLEIKVVPTDFGDIWLRARFNRQAPDRPILLIIRGAFARLDDWTILTQVFRQADVVIADLPGFNCPGLSVASVPEFALAFEQAIDSAFSDRKVVVFGMSIGGLVAMSLRNARVAGVIACDPPLTTIDLWPLRAMLREYVERETTTPYMLQWVEKVFGVTAEGAVNVDYTGLLDHLPRPTTIIVATEPLEPERPVSSIPGLINAADRKRIFAMTDIGCFSSKGGHNVALQDKWTVAATINLALYGADRL